MGDGPSPSSAGGAPRCHVIPVHTGVAGRLRARVFALKGDPRLAARIESVLAGIPGISAVSASPRTGRVLLRHDPRRPADDVLAELRAAAGGRPARVKGTSRLPAATESPPETQGASSPWHTREAAAVLADMGSEAATGLPASEAAARLRRHGANVIADVRPFSRLEVLLKQFVSVPVALLGVSAAVSLATGGLADAAAIAVVVAINAAVGYITESQAERTIRSLTIHARRDARVWRDGAALEIPIEDVVPGDIMALLPGTFVAADARLVEARDLTVDESMLTGESLPVRKGTKPLAHGRAPLAERTNMVYKGTLVTGGSGRAVVVATGPSTEMGAIQKLVGEARSPQTPMQRQLDGLGRQLALLSGGVCGGVFLMGIARGYGTVPMLKASTALAVAAVPEGLSAVATITLALGLREMRRHKVLVRRLEAVENLGSVGVICFDKTGTLTVNRMSVTAVNAGGAALALHDGAFAHARDGTAATDLAELRQLLDVVALCNDARLTADGEAVVGTPTEAALLRAAACAGIDVAKLRKRLPRRATRNRSEGRNVMVTVHEEAGGGHLEAMKGAPAEVLARCRWVQRGGVRTALGDDDRAAMIAENDRMAAAALRVLGVAWRTGDDDDAGAEDGFTWLGLVGMTDPVRAGMRDLMTVFHGAGIRTVMITGDQSTTAYAIAREMELSGGRPVDILDSTRIDGMEPQLLAALTRQADVFARVSPAHKLQIVRGLQQGGDVVAMTGDGINDGPALKAADIGIAMGASGADVAHELADVILEDDNIETMAQAIAQGRSIHDNIRKSLHFLLATNLSEITTVFSATALGAGEPLTPIQLLWINIVTDIFPGIALALEPPDRRVLERPPRDPSEPIVGRRDLARMGIEGAVISTGAMGAYGWGLARYGIGPQARTLAFISLTTAQLLHALCCRSDSRFIGGRHLPPNPALAAAVAGTAGITALAPLIPPLRRILGLTPLGPVDMAVTAAAAVLPIAVNEAAKPWLARIGSVRRADITKRDEA